MTQVITSLEELEKTRASISGTVAFVPTMGALHEGHQSLIKKAKEIADYSFVSIFVNPLQFAAGEDFEQYPQNLPNDTQKCKELAVDFIFAPNAKEIYPQGKESSPVIKADPQLANRLCGLKRNGHFDGVCTVVKILFDLIKADYAIFGEKDYQQLKIIEAMVQEHKIKTKIIAAPIFREPSGLAMSSRNQYLNESERHQASSLYQELLALEAKLKERSSMSEVDEIFTEEAKSSCQKLEEQGFAVEYLELFDNRILVAAHLAKTRLIDNIKLN